MGCSQSSVSASQRRKQRDQNFEQSEISIVLTTEDGEQKELLGPHVEARKLKPVRKADAEKIETKDTELKKPRSDVTSHVEAGTKKGAPSVVQQRAAIVQSEESEKSEESEESEESDTSHSHS